MPNDDIPWEFYKLAPKGIMAVVVPLGLKRFVKEDVERVYAPLDWTSSSNNSCFGGSTWRPSSANRF